MNYNEQLQKIYQERQKVKESVEHYVELETESGTISIPRKVAIKAFNSSIEHFKSRINYQKEITNQFNQD